MVTVSANVFLRVMTTVFVMIMPLAAIGSAAAEPAVRSAETGVLTGRHAPGFDLDHAGEITVLEYRTEAPIGGTTPATGVLAVPRGVAPDHGWPVIAWDHGTSGVGPGCGVSSGYATEDQRVLDHYLSRGYAVVAPDYVGLGPTADTTHPYLHLRTEATATVDAVRAAHSARADLATRWAVAGVSQGGHAALATARIASARAPELAFRGTAAIEPASAAEYAFGLFGPAFPEVPGIDGLNEYAAAILLGLRTVRPDIDVNSYLSPRGVDILDRLVGTCQNRWHSIIRGASIGSLLARSLDDPAFRRAVADYTAVPADGYDRPIFFAHGYTDLAVPIPATAVLLARMSAAGTRYEFRVYDGDHRTTPGLARADVDDFLRRVLE